MKIALLIERMDVSRGGRETSTAQIAAELARRGHEVAIICRSGSWRGEGVQVVPLGRRGLSRASRLGHFVADAQQAVRDGGYDIAHAMLPVVGANVYQPRGGTIPGQVAAGQRRLGSLGPLRAAIFDPLNLCRRRLARLERQVVADPGVRCLAVSEMVAEEFRRFYGRERGVVVVYNGVDVPDPAGEQRADARQRLRYKLGLGRDDLVFITMATNFPLKGVRETIVAFSRWFHSRTGSGEARLIVAGRDHPEAYERAAGLREVGRQVVFVGPTDRPFDLYAAADACILLSWYDPCSRVVLEAVRWGIPAITTVFNGAAEVLSEGAGIVVDSPKNVAAVAAAMEKLADAEERERRSVACRCVADRISVERHVDELLATYASVERRPG